MKRVLSVAAMALACVVLPGDRAASYVTQGIRWHDGQIVMHMQLGSSGALIDGNTSWDAVATDALATWNIYLDRVQFSAALDTSNRVGSGNRVNNVFWQSDVYGKAFNSYASPTQTGTILAVSLYWWSGSYRTESDVVFNNSSSIPWNSYRGNLRRSSGGGTLNDFRRVAMHEFGHTLGLEHPNDYGQTVRAQMNSNESDLDTLAGDDISGAQALYSLAGNGTVTFPPRNESLDFRSQLEAKYRDQLHRGALATYVDNEGDIVWTSEYLRYRVNNCSHDSAVFRVLNQIDGNGLMGVCGNAPAGQVNFPPRNEALQFRTQLEAKYRDDLQRGPNYTSVDNEGDVVWTQEYLRYRVNGCTHADAVQRVFRQIDGYGIQPVCR